LACRRAPSFILSTTPLERWRGPTGPLLRNSPPECGEFLPEFHRADQGNTRSARPHTPQECGEHGAPGSRRNGEFPFLQKKSSFFHSFRSPYSFSLPPGGANGRERGFLLERGSRGSHGRHLNRPASLLVPSDFREGASITRRYRPPACGSLGNPLVSHRPSPRRPTVPPVPPQ